MANSEKLKKLNEAVEKCVEVIGNIFDNPELLQEESDE